MKNALEKIHLSGTQEVVYSLSEVILIQAAARAAQISFPFNLIGYSFPVGYRLFAPVDFAALYAVEELCFEPPFRFSSSYMQQLIESPDSATWIAGDGAELIGFSIVEWTTDHGETTAYIQTIEVHPAWRGHGIGAELLSRVENSARAAGAHIIGLHVDVENAAAIRLYESRGYTRRGREEHYYARHRAAFSYAKLLPRAFPLMV